MYKKKLSLLLVISLFTSPIFSQTPDENTNLIQDDTNSLEYDTSIPDNASIPKPKAIAKNDIMRKNWIFVGASLLASAIGFYVVGIHQGHDAP